MGPDDEPGIFGLDHNLAGPLTGLAAAPLLKEFAANARIILFTFCDVCRYYRVGGLSHVVLVDEPGENPGGGVPLFAGPSRSATKISSMMGLKGSSFEVGVG